MSPDLPQLLDRIARRIERLLARHGLAAAPEAGDAVDAWTEDAPTLAGLAAAAVQGRAALGPRAGAWTRRSGDTIDLTDGSEPGGWRAHGWGFDLHAGGRVATEARARLERLCRYALRPAVGQTRRSASRAGGWIRCAGMPAMPGSAPSGCVDTGAAGD